MSFEISGSRFSLEAAADLSAKQYRAVKVDSTGKAALCGDGEAAIGILQNKPTSGQTAEIWGVGNVSKFEQSASLTIGAYVNSDANGLGQADAASKYRIGILLANGGAANAIGSVMITLSGKES